MAKDTRVYVTRSSYSSLVRVFPATVGIRKFHGCIEFGAAWNKHYVTGYLFKSGYTGVQCLNRLECQARYGFYPSPGTAYYVDGKKKEKVDIDFSN